MNTLLSQIAEILRKDELSGFAATGDGFYGGKYVRKLEYAFTKYFKVKYAISFNSATSALHAACIACGVRQASEVITTPYTFSATASSIAMARANLVFVDILPDTYNLDPDLIEQSITKRTKAIMPVHLHGYPCDMDEIMPIALKYKLKVIEDASQAIGAIYQGKKVGTIGHCGVFSFNRFKQINAGEGGMLVTNSKNIARTAMLVRNHGECQSKTLGYNYRMTEITAVIALHKFLQLDIILMKRNTLADYMSYYLSRIPGIEPMEVHPDCYHAYYTYPIKVNRYEIGMHRNELQRRLAKKGVYWGNENYGKPLYLQSTYKRLGYKLGACPVAERMWRDEAMVTDILKPGLTLCQVDDIIRIMGGVLHGKD